MAKTLYLCYFGLREPLVQTQVLPYLREIMRSEPPIEVSLLTFEPRGVSDTDAARIKAELAAEGIEWNWLKYHKRFSVLATAYDIFRGTLFTWNKLRTDKIDVLHGRVHVPTLMGALARKFSRQKPKLLFDIRGFFPEEYTDAGRWPENGWLFRSAKRVEKWLLDEANGFVVLTEKARDVLFPGSRESGLDALGRPVEVIPCCVDFDRRFSAIHPSARLEYRRELGIDDRFVIVHLGALGGLYLTNEIVKLVSAERRRNLKAYLLLLTHSDSSEAIDLLDEHGFHSTDYLITKVAPNDVPKYLAASDVAISFVKGSFSTLSRSPTKIPEYLACGLPVISNAGVGDVDLLVNKFKVGTIIDEFSEQGYLIAVDSTNALRKETRFEEHSREVALAEFDLVAVGGTRYRRLYQRITGGFK